MIQRIRQSRRDAVVVLAGHHHEGIRPSEELGEALEYLGRLPLGIFLVHAVEQGEIQLGWIHEGRFTPAVLEMTNDETGGLQSLAIGADLAKDHWCKEWHLILLFVEVTSAVARLSR